ncbi:hypothetical protein BDV59DRAFT_201859 [Aspergillus ambiguus]|uniref:uncharacterized protein n=1 Tax=Aspergillus ambiguus TaxID=176160 RepID=UPI003CCE52D0
MSSNSSSSRLQNDFGADLWVRESEHKKHHPTTGRGLFAGLQDVKSYNVDNGWAKRRPSETQSGLWNFLTSRYVIGLSSPIQLYVC